MERVDIGIDDEDGEDDVAEAAGQPDGEKENQEHAGGQEGGDGGLGVHEDVGGGSPGADEDVAGVWEFGAGQEPGDQDAQESGGIDQIPVFEEAEVDFDFFVGKVMEIVRRGMLGVRGGG